MITKTAMIAATALVLFPTVSHASVDLTTAETLMLAQFQESVALYNYSSPVSADPIDYSFSVNTLTGAFSYNTLPGQSYNGSSFSISGAGSYVSETGVYDWSAVGMLGAATWAEQGEVTWTGDPEETINNAVVVVNGKPIGTLSGTVNVDVQGDSSGPVQFTPTTGGTVTYNATDNSLPGLQGYPWKFHWNGHTADVYVNLNFAPQGVNPLGIINGQSELTMSAPEPSAWALMLVGFGALGILGYGRDKPRKGPLDRRATRQGRRPQPIASSTRTS